MLRVQVTVVALMLLVLVGCNYSTAPGREVAVSGKVVGPDGQPLTGIRVAFVATGGAAVSNAFTLGPDGSFSGKLIAGKYSYFLSPLSENDKKGQAIISKLPEKWTKADLDRQISVSGGTLDLKF